MSKQSSPSEPLTLTDEVVPVTTGKKVPVPYGPTILVQDCENPIAESEAGIVLVDTHSDKKDDNAFGIVYACGAVDFPIPRGTMVTFNRYSNLQFRLGSEHFRALRPNDILSIIEDA